MATSNPFKLALVQMRCAEPATVMLDKAITFTREAAAGGATLICLPELFTGPYFCQTENEAEFARAEPVPGPTTRAFESLCAELDVTVALSLFEKRTEGLYHNALAVVDGKHGYIGKYRKMHIPDDPRYLEKYYFAPGDLGYRCFDTQAVQLGTLVCWDQWYPEAARLSTLLGAQLLLYPTAIGWHPEEKQALGDIQRDAWLTIQRGHAIANGCFVAAVNRVGFEAAPEGETAGIEFYGSSFVVAPDGSVIAQADSESECVLYADIDLSQISELRHGWPFLRDRRIDSYADLTRRYIDSDDSD